MEVLPHIPHTWGNPFPMEHFDLVVASDILIYVKQYSNLIKTLKQLCLRGSIVWLSNRRRINTEKLFLEMCSEEGLSTQEIGPKVFEIKLI